MSHTEMLAVCFTFISEFLFDPYISVYITQSCTLRGFPLEGTDCMKPFLGHVPKRSRVGRCRNWGLFEY